MAINKYKKTIEALFESQNNPLCAGEIINLLAAEKLSPNKTTVYRTLNSLVLGGYLKQIVIDTNTCYYEKAQSHHHHHFICTKCKLIEDFEPDMADENKLAEKFKTKKILFHTLEFFGLCENCK